MEKFYQYEELSITVVKRINKKRVCILLIVLLLILLLILLGVYQAYNKVVAMKREEELLEMQKNSIEIADVNGISKVEEQTEAREEHVIKKIPVLTQLGREKMANIYKSEEKVAYLTFDDGPSSNITPQILNILEQYQINATFFLLGRNVDRYPELVKEEYNKGHYIANHGYSHEYDKIYSSAQSILDEYNRTEESIRVALGIHEYSSHLFRYPGGTGGKKYKTVKNEAKQLLSDNNVLYVDWNALTNDSVGKPTAESIMSELIETVGTKNSVVILMHDASTKQLTADTLPQVIEYLQGQGYTFKTFYDVIV